MPKRAASVAPSACTPKPRTTASSLETESMSASTYFFISLKPPPAWAIRSTRIFLSARPCSPKASTASLPPNKPYKPPPKSDVALPALAAEVSDALFASEPICSGVLALPIRPPPIAAASPPTPAPAPVAPYPIT